MQQVSPFRLLNKTSLLHSQATGRITPQCPVHVLNLDWNLKYILWSIGNTYHCIYQKVSFQSFVLTCNVLFLWSFRIFQLWNCHHEGCLNKIHQHIILRLFGKGSCRLSSWQYRDNSNAHCEFLVLLESSLDFSELDFYTP